MEEGRRGGKSERPSGDVPFVRTCSTARTPMKIIISAKWTSLPACDRRRVVTSDQLDTYVAVNRRACQRMQTH